MDAIYHLTKQRRYYHPLPIFLSFISIILLLVLIPHPFITTISLIVSAYFLIKTKQWHWPNQLFSLGLYVIIVLTNPIFVTKGATILFYCFGSPYTLEALIYGIVFANMIVSMLWWCFIFNHYLKSDHIVYLFSKPFKVIALMISIIFNLIPKIKKQLQETILYQKKYSQKSLFKKSLDTFLTIVTWSFESSLTMVDSMNARGYQAKRTHFHLFHFLRQDMWVCLLILLMDSWLIVYYLLDFSQYYFYPLLKPISFDTFNLLSYGIIALLMMIPILFKKEEEDA